MRNGKFYLRAHSPTTHCSLPTTHRPPPTAHRPLPTAHCPLLSCAPMGTHRLMIVAGEASGDAHAAALVRALREAAPQLDFFGATGPLLRSASVESVVRSDDLAILG